jgi:hypothetical protein
MCCSVTDDKHRRISIGLMEHPSRMNILLKVLAGAGQKLVEMGFEEDTDGVISKNVMSCSLGRNITER